jgi:transposase
MVAAIGDGAAFAKGRDFAGWLGLVPRQMSTGDRTILGRITKRGNRYLRMLFIQGTRAIQLHPASWAKHSFGFWLTAAARRLHHNVLTVALANKLARIAQLRAGEVRQALHHLGAAADGDRAGEAGYPLTAETI